MIGFAGVVCAWIGVWFAHGYLPRWQWFMLVAGALWFTDHMIGTFIEARQK